MYQIYIDEIKREITDVSFMTMKANETTHVSSSFTIIIILLSSSNSESVERLLNFVKIHNRTATGLTNVLKEELKSFNFTEKLIAQAYMT